MEHSLDALPRGIDGLAGGDSGVRGDASPYWGPSAMGASATGSAVTVPAAHHQLLQLSLSGVKGVDSSLIP